MTSNDPQKVQEILNMLDYDQRKKLAYQYHKRMIKTTEDSKDLINYTQTSFQKYDSVKVVNFLLQLEDHQLTPTLFACEIQNYFNYHSERK